eukprot:Opistho-2@24615
MEPHTRALIIDSLFTAAWSEGRDISDAEVVRLTITEALACHWRPAHRRHIGGTASSSEHSLSPPAEPAEIDTMVSNRGPAEAAKSMIALAGTDAVKDLLRRQTNAAIADGVFGVPTYIVDGELFWGSDTVIDVDNFMSGRDPVDHGYFERVALNVAPSAERRRSLRGV